MTLRLAGPQSAGGKLTCSGAAQHIVEACLSDAPLGRVGLEAEAHCYDAAEPRRRPGWCEITRVIGSLPAMPGGSAVSVEPGGAVELSGPPVHGAAAAIAAMAEDQALLRSVFTAAGLGLVLLGTDPLRPARRINPGARYRAMERFFAATGSRTVGAAMMTSTASIQVNLDAGPAAGWAARMRLAQTLGPTMIAIAANSPLLNGRFTGWLSTRQRVWNRLDAARCGPIPKLGGTDPATEWARFALKAPVMLVCTADGTIPVTRRVPFADWAERRVLLGGRYPTTADLDYHLTTLFPPARPRGWLEIRYLDAVPDAIWPALVFTLATLLDDPVAADIAAEAVEPVADAWDTAARIGLDDRRLHKAASTCVTVAAMRAPEQLRAAMRRLVLNVEQGRCPADDFTDQVIRRGVAPTVARLAQIQR
ncbi:MAG TPA: ergothioneine biosynthesis glutamate--cysteine ligase EgtA [Mycobacterium sp.]|nr:ergothioneine biosynthesis glutamate--cysteine ligase EgtA [Mycobacterium sp.]